MLRMLTAVAVLASGLLVVAGAAPDDKKSEPKQAFASPFRDLKKMLSERQIAPAAEKKPVAPPPSPPMPAPLPETDEDAFLRAVESRCLPPLDYLRGN